MTNLPVKVTGLRALRLAHHLTQRELGKAAGVADVLISRWERGAPPPIWKRLARIADVLGCSTDEVLGRVVPERPVDAVGRAERELLDAMREDVVKTFGPKMAIGWMTAARMMWGGALQRASNEVRGIGHVLEAPPEPTPETALTRLPEGRMYPTNWFQGWQSPRQVAREQNLPDPKQSKRLQKPWDGTERRRLLQKGDTP